MAPGRTTRVQVPCLRFQTGRHWAPRVFNLHGRHRIWAVTTYRPGSGARATRRLGLTSRWVMLWSIRPMKPTEGVKGSPTSVGRAQRARSYRLQVGYGTDAILEEVMRSRCP